MKVKNYFTKIISVILLFSLIFTISGCFFKAEDDVPAKQPDTGDATPVTPEQPPENTDPEPTPSISFTEFIVLHKDKAVDFVYDYVKPTVVNGRTVKAENISVSANADDELAEVDFICTYALSGNERAIEYVKAVLEAPVDLDKIVEGKVVKSEVKFTVDTKTVLAFNAETVAKNQEIAKAMYKVANLSAYTGTMLYGEVESSVARTRAFNLAEFTNSGVKVHNITVANINDSTLLNDLSNTIKAQNKGVKATYKLSGTIISASKYALEESGTAPIDPEITSITDLITKYPHELASALEANFMGALNEKVLYNAKSYISKSWDIGTSDTISEIKLIVNYVIRETNHAIGVITIKLKTPINVKDINKDNIGSIWASYVDSSTYKRDYSFGYETQLQGTRDSLVNAIFEAKGIEPKEGATRLFVDVAHILDPQLKESREFKVAEITENGITEFSILIKEANNDAEYIENLKDSARYRFLTAYDKTYSYSQNQVSNNK